MEALSAFSTRHPNERPTHPVDPSRAPARFRTRRIKSKTGGASYDRIIRLPAEPAEVSVSTASSDQATDKAGGRQEETQRSLTRPSLFSAYRVRTHLRIGMMVSFFR